MYKHTTARRHLRRFWTFHSLLEHLVMLCCMTPASCFIFLFTNQDKRAFRRRRDGRKNMCLPARRRHKKLAWYFQWLFSLWPMECAHLICYFIFIQIEVRIYKYSNRSDFILTAVRKYWGKKSFLLFRLTSERRWSSNSRGG